MTDSFLGKEVQVFGSWRDWGGTAHHLGQVTLHLHRTGPAHAWYLRMASRGRSVSPGHFLTA